MTDQEIIQALKSFIEIEPNLNSDEYNTEMDKLAKEFGVKKQVVDDALAAIENGVGESYALKGIKIAKGD